MAAGDASQTIPVQITHVFFVWCATQFGHVKQHNTKTSVISTGVAWLSSPAVIVLHANEAICKLTRWDEHKSTTNINSPRWSDNWP